MLALATATVNCAHYRITMLYLDLSLTFHLLCFSNRSTYTVVSYNHMTQNMPLNYQLCPLKQLCYIPGPHSWWITFGITASRGDWLSAASAVIDLPRCERQILEAGFDSLPQQHDCLFKLIPASLAKDKITRSLHVSTPAGAGIHAKIEIRIVICLRRLDGRCVNELFTTVLSWCQICLRL